MVRFRLLLAGALMFAILTFANGHAHAASILDFEGVVGVGGQTFDNVTPYSEDGFTLQSSGSAAVFHNAIFHNRPGFVNGNLTSIFGGCGSCPGAPFTFTLSGPTPFDLLSIDFGGLATGTNPGIIDATGFFAGGGTISQAVDPNALFSTFLFPGFTNLASLQFGLRVAGRDVALDNIVVAPAAVPEPTSLLLFGSGAAALLVKARRRKKQQIQ